MGFFQSIREAIKCGKFDTFRQKFIEGRRAHLTSAAVCLRDPVAFTWNKLIIIIKKIVVRSLVTILVLLQRNPSA